MIYEFDGHTPEIAADAWIAPDANIIGKVRIGAGASVWFGATIRGDNEPIEVGARSNIQENSVLHTDMGYPLRVGADCTIGHKAMLHGCTIEDCVLVGMDATVLNGAVIGTNSLIGAGALVSQNKVIPPGSLVVGAPGKVVRELDDATRASLLKSARGYAEKAARYRAQLGSLQR